jgi:hypothetical protein
VEDGGSLVDADRARALAEPLGGLGEQALPIGQDPLTHRQLVFLRCTSAGPPRA